LNALLPAQASNANKVLTTDGTNSSWFATTNWDTAYTDRLKWDGGSTGLNAATARTSLGLGTAATLNVGTSASNIVQLDGTGKLPAVNGSLLTGVTATDSSKVAKTGDTMTGTLNLPANGLVAGTNQLVLSGGNVGIGTTAPSGVLDVEGSGNVILNAGNVGIGTSNPLYSLDVRAATGKMQLLSTTGTNLAYFDISNGTNALRSGVEGSGGNMLLPAIAYGAYIESAFNYPISLGVGGNRYLTVGTAGNVGIGTTSPTQLLTVNGTIESKSGGVKFPDGTVQATAGVITGCPAGMTLVAADLANGFTAFCIDSATAATTGAEGAFANCQNVTKRLCRAMELIRASTVLGISCASGLWNGDGLGWTNGANSFSNVSSTAACTSSSWAPHEYAYGYRCCR
jgi:hypothetical protein